MVYEIYLLLKFTDTSPWEQKQTNKKQTNKNKQTNKIKIKQVNKNILMLYIPNVQNRSYCFIVLHVVVRIVSRHNISIVEYSWTRSRAFCMVVTIIGDTLSYTLISLWYSARPSYAYQLYFCNHIDKHIFSKYLHGHLLHNTTIPSKLIEPNSQIKLNDNHTYDNSIWTLIWLILHIYNVNIK
jgi:hypothetical protein